MRKVLIGFLLIMFCLGTAGCPAKKPVQEPAPKPLVVPETSKVGFSPVDLNNAPDVVKNIASDISKREQAAWLQVNGTNYLLVSAGEKAAGRVEITDITQKIPAQNFVWLDVKAKYTSAEKGDNNNGDNNNQVTVVSLNLVNNTSINGVGFEITKTVTETKATTPAPAPTTTPEKATSPAPATKPTPAAPSAPAAPGPAPAPATGPDKSTTETGDKKAAPTDSKNDSKTGPEKNNQNN